MNKKIFAVGVIVLILDQITKILVGTYLPYGDSVTIIKNFFSLTNISNTGAAFSILQGRTMFIVILSIAIMIIVFRMISSFEKNMVNNIAFGLLFGGIFGNLGDRMFLGMVRDFLKFKIFGYSFPVFNVADIGVVIGVALLVFSILKGSEQNGSNSAHRRERTNR